MQSCSLSFRFISFDLCGIYYNMEGFVTYLLVNCLHYHFQNVDVDESFCRQTVCPSLNSIHTWSDLQLFVKPFWLWDCSSLFWLFCNKNMQVNDSPDTPQWCTKNIIPPPLNFGCSFIDFNVFFLHPRLGRWGRVLDKEHVFLWQLWKEPP